MSDLERYRRHDPAELEELDELPAVPEWHRPRRAPVRPAARVLRMLPPALPGPGIRLTDDAPAPLRRWSGAVIVVVYTLAGLAILAAVGLIASVVAVVAYRLLTAVIG